MHKWFGENVIQHMRREINAAGDNEVFFCGVLNEGRLENLKVVARGNANSVAAVLPEKKPGMLVIHNHPSGDLTPSGADITVASKLGRDGIGFVIVDNTVTNIYVVVEPVQREETVGILPEQVEQVLAPGGRIASVMEGFESRSQQVQMALDVAETLNRGQHALAEAGTGTGKSLAYLVPLVLWTKANNERAVVSTNTINLQEQLIFKDIPLLRQALPHGFKAVLVKGRGNYLCRRKLKEVVQQGGNLVAEKDIASLQALMAWQKQTRDGTRSDLNFAPSQELWELVNSDADVCLRINCPHFRDCFFHAARREALDAQLLIVNHSLLFADIAMRTGTADTGVLPDYHAIVLDEAHNIEKVATDWLGSQVTRNNLLRLTRRLWTTRRNNVRGLLVTLESKLVAAPDTNRDILDGVQQLVHQQLVPSIMKINSQGNEFFTGLVQFLQQKGQDKLRLTEDVIAQPGWLAQKQKTESLLAQLEELDQYLGALYRRLENLGPHGFEVVMAQAMELSSIQAKLSALASALEEIAFGSEQGLVRWVELHKSPAGPWVQMNYAPLAVRDLLRQKVWEQVKSVVLTSATLTVGNSYKFIRQRLGLDNGLNVQEFTYQSPFDYKSKVLVGVAMDLHAPGQQHYQSQVARSVLGSLQGSQGRALVLFTSFAMLKSTAAAIREEVETMGISLLCQGELPRHTLVRKFRQDTSSVLLATASFWEGVDVAGESLSNVILTRLPFTVPDEPVTEARMEELRRQGKSPFYSYQVPQAVLRFKQGFGRLIRTKSDTGVVLVLDNRIATKSYGRWFMESLPSCPTKSAPLKEILNWQQQFLANK